MSPLLTYLLKFSLSLAMVYLFYRLFLRRLTFYNWNRWYLLGYSALCFLIPFIDISGLLKKQEWTAAPVLQWVPQLGPVADHAVNPETAAGFSASKIVLPVLLAGALFFLLRLLIQLFSFRKMLKRSKWIAGDRVKVYEVAEGITPFSFGRSVFVNPSRHSPEELREIIRHEIVHVKQLHSLDIIWGEILCLLNWYNPFAWWLKKAIRQNLEFIADRQVLEKGISRKDYQYLLLKVTGNQLYSIASPFNFSSLKKRIAMMNKLQSARTSLLRFLFILPLLAVILVSFRREIGDTLSPSKELLQRPDAPLFVIDTVPPVTTPNNKGYLIDIIGVNGECVVVVKDKDKKEVKRVLLNEWKEKQDAMESLYGEILPPPPPKAPEPPGTPAAPDFVEAPAPPSPPAPPGAPTAPQPPVPADCGEYTEYTYAPGATGSGYNLWSISQDWQISDKTAVIRLRNGGTEKFDLTDPEEKALFEKKYGKYFSYTVQPVRAATMASQGNRYTVTPAAIVPHPGVQPVDDLSHIITGKEDIIITITRKSTKTDLDRFISEMKAKEVELLFDHTEFDEKGNLISLSGTMRSGGSKSHFSVTDFSKLVLAMMKKDGKTWLKVNTTDREVI